MNENTDIGYDPSKAVAKGVALLDQHLPDWVDRIETDTLDVSDTTLCVLGQLFPDPYRFGGWGAGMRYLLGDTKNATSSSHGFEIPRKYLNQTEWAVRDEAYAVLGAEWQRVIGERRSCRRTTPRRPSCWLAGER